MSKYFSKFPSVLYGLEKDVVLELVTNIMSRWSFENKLKENTAAYYEYLIRDGDTPEIIAHKVYGDSEYHWAVLMFNDTVDPQFDWPLQYSDLIKFMNEKYYTNADTANTGMLGITWAQSNIKDYYIVENTQSSYGYSNTYITCDLATYNNVGSYSQTTVNTSINNIVTCADGTIIEVSYTSDAQTYYDYEIEFNESKRNIKLLKKEFLGPLIIELERVLA